MSTTTIYSGAVIDGPWFGRNLAHDLPCWRVSVRPTLPQRVREALCNEPILGQAGLIDHVEYRYSMVHHVWSCGIPVIEYGDVKLSHRTAAKYRRKGKGRAG